MTNVLNFHKHIVSRLDEGLDNYFKRTTDTRESKSLDQGLEDYWKKNN
ncbi:hypothetical protein pb186bvf_008755 [Paramecium bursaria]